MIAANPGDVFRTRVEIADEGLREHGVRSQLQIQIVENQVRESVETWECLASDRAGVVVARIAKAELIGKARTEGVIFGKARKTAVCGNCRVKHRQFRSGIDLAGTAADVANPNLIGSGDGVVEADYREIVVLCSWAR